MLPFPSGHQNRGCDPNLQNFIWTNLVEYFHIHDFFSHALPPFFLYLFSCPVLSFEHFFQFETSPFVSLKGLHFNSTFHLAQSFSCSSVIIFSFKHQFAWSLVLFYSSSFFLFFSLSSYSAIFRFLLNRLASFCSSSFFLASSSAFAFMKPVRIFMKSSSSFFPS